MVETILPDVYIDVRAEGLIAPGRITVGRMGVVGTAKKGPIDSPVLISSYAEAVDTFGGPDAWLDGKSDELSLVRALRLAYANGATSVYAVRVSAKDNQGKPTASAAVSTIASTTGPCVTLTARSPGTWGEDLQVEVGDADSDPVIRDEKHNGPPATLNHHPVLKSARTRVRWFQALSGVTRDLVVFYDGDNDPGEPHQVKIDRNPGTLTFSDAIDPADTVTATYVVPRGNAVKVTVTDGKAKENYNVVDGASLVDRVNDKVASSALVVAKAEANAAELPLTTTAPAGFKGGADGGSGADYQSGLDSLLSAEAHIIVAAGQSDRDVGAALAAHCDQASTDELKHDRIAVVGSALGASVDAIAGHSLDSGRLVFVAPGVATRDELAQPPQVVLPGGYAAAAVGGLIAGLPAHFSPTNKPVRADGLEQDYTSAELAELVEARVLALEDRNGPRVVKGITTSANTAWTQITTRRIVDYAKYGVRSAASPYIGLLNNPRVRSALRTTINSFLANMVNDEMLESYDLDVTATRDEERQGIARATMVLRPVFSIDYILVTIFLE